MFLQINKTITFSFVQHYESKRDPDSRMNNLSAGVDPGFFLGGGALVSCSTSTPINHSFFFCKIPVVFENRRSSQGGGGGRAAHPLHPPPRSAPEAVKN